MPIFGSTLAHKIPVVVWMDQTQTVQDLGDEGVHQIPGAVDIEAVGIHILHFPAPRAEGGNGATGVHLVVEKDDKHSVQTNNLHRRNYRRSLVKQLGAADMGQGGILEMDPGKKVHSGRNFLPCLLPAADVRQDYSMVNYPCLTVPETAKFETNYSCSRQLSRHFEPDVVFLNGATPRCPTNKRNRLLGS